MIIYLIFHLKLEQEWYLYEMFYKFHSILFKLSIRLLFGFYLFPGVIIFTH